MSDTFDLSDILGIAAPAAPTAGERAFAVLDGEEEDLRSGMVVVPDNADLDPKAVRMISQEESDAVGVRLEDGELLVAFYPDPTPARIATLEAHAGVPIIPGRVANQNAFARFRQRVNALTQVRSDICELILDRALEMHASDVHLAVGSAPKVRVGGSIETIPGMPIVTSSDLDEIAKYLVRGDLLDVLDIKKDIDCAASYSGWRLRIAVFHQMQSKAMAIRIIPRTIPDMGGLGLPTIVADIALNHKNGLVLICGITGSGKSTTLAAMLDMINRQRDCHIITIEDPVEYLHKDKMATVHQREIGVDAISFQTALRHALRQDPDVLLVGEMRDYETMQMALDAAETGHLVFATVHARDASSVVSRIVSGFPSDQQEHVRAQLAESLVGVVIQKLLPSAINPFGAQLVCEVMIPNDAIRNHIRLGDLHQIANDIATASEAGMQLFDYDLARCVHKGLLRPGVAKSHVKDPKIYQEFLSMLTSGGRTA